MKNIFYCLAIFFFFSCISLLAQVEECFAQWDANKDGKITLEEFPGAKDNTEYFRLIDADNNGFISKEELSALLLTNTQQSIPENTRWEKGYKELEQQVIHFRTKSEQMEQENNLLKKQIAERPAHFQKDNQQFKVQIEALGKERDELRNALQRLQAEKSSGYGMQPLQTENQQLRKQIEALGKERDELRNALQRLQAEKSSGYGMQPLQTENQQLRKQIEDMNREMISLRNQIAQLQRDLAQASQKPYTPVVPQYPAKQEDTIESSLRKPGSPAQDTLMAEEAARVDALRNLAGQIRGNWIAACSQNIDAQNRLVVIGSLEPTHLVGVSQLNSDFDFMSSMVTVPVQISRANIIESIRRANPNMTAEDYQELRFMFPEILTAKGYGAWSANAQKKLMAFYGSQLDARRKLVEHLRGFVIKSSSRMENFVLQNHQVIVSIESTLLIGVNVLKEEIISNSIAQTTLEISRAMFIYSMRKGLESNGLQLSPEEYQNLRNMLSQDKYQFTGKAAVQ